MKAWKIIRNTLLGMAALVVLALVGLQIALRPKLLTGIVNRIADGLVEGKVEFREVKAHVIKSFPFLHLEAEDLAVTYPSPLVENRTDTLASLKRLDLSLDYVALTRGKYHIRHLELFRPRLSITSTIPPFPTWTSCSGSVRRRSHRPRLPFRTSASTASA